MIDQTMPLPPAFAAWAARHGYNAEVLAEEWAIIQGDLHKPYGDEGYRHSEQAAQSLAKMLVGGPQIRAHFEKASKLTADVVRQILIGIHAFVGLTPKLQNEGTYVFEFVDDSNIYGMGAGDLLVSRPGHPTAPVLLLKGEGQDWSIVQSRTEDDQVSLLIAIQRGHVEQRYPAGKRFEEDEIVQCQWRLWTATVERQRSMG